MLLDPNEEFENGEQEAQEFTDWFEREAEEQLSEYD